MVHSVLAVVAGVLGGMLGGRLARGSHGGSGSNLAGTGGRTMVGRVMRPFWLPSAVALLAVPALRSPGEWWASGLSTLATLALMSAVVAARFGPSGARPYFWGFATVGWAYVLVAFGIVNQNWPRRDLFTSVVIDQAWRGIFPEAVGDPQAFSVRLAHFHTIGHALFALALAHAGGLLASTLARRQGEPPSAVGASPT